ncbi:MAG TPA: porin [Tepidisphaeraceae bacterium]|jgi:hypothetical protein|nr:porin [Tepidisphaeraceae bacterium]
MLRRSACLGLAVAAALATTRFVRADEPTPAANLSLTPVLADAATTPPPSKPLMAVLEGVGVGHPLEDAGINITGFVEGAWTYNFDTPDNHTNVGRVFDFEDQDKQFSQADLQISRSVDATKGKFDIGFMVEWIYGSDARLIHSNGLNFYGPNNANVGLQPGPNEQFDLVQANVQLAIPVGTGLTITAGKFVTLLGYETINPTGNPLYSHSYMFGFAIPFTNTGVIGKYNLTKDIALTLGMTRGWEQTSKDNNGSVDGIGQLSWAVSDKFNIIVSAICGPEQDSDSSHYRSVIDVIATYQLGDNTKIGLNADYGYGSRQGNDVGFDGKAGTADWWGAAVYVSQKFDSHFTFNVRAEYFNDDDGARGLDTAVTELTAGLAITPFPDNQWASGLLFRPEIRWDHANNEIFNDGGDKNQYTVGGDLIYAF